MDKLQLQRSYLGDKCFKYIPRHDFQSFIDQIQITQGQLLRYMPKRIRQFDNNYQNTKRIISIGFWTVDILFVTFCHKIKLISRIFSNKWAMFTFKLSCILFPFAFHIFIQNMAAKQHLARIYSNIEDQYRKYKNTGDILLLNPEINIVDFSQPLYQQNSQKSAEQKTSFSDKIL